MTIRRVFLLSMIFTFVAGGQDLRPLGQSTGYDPQQLTGYLQLSRFRLLLDLAGEWQVQAGGTPTVVKVPSGIEYEGKVVYRKTFIPGREFAGTHFRLHLWGTNFGAEIRINDEFIVNYTGGYLERQIDLRTDLIRIDEENTIEITVDTERNNVSSLPRTTRILQPRTAGGIFREIFLVASPRATIDQHRLEYAISNDLRRAEIRMTMHMRDYDASFAARDTSLAASMMEKQSDYRYLIEVFTEEDPEPVYTNRFKKYRNVWEIPKIREQNPESYFSMGAFKDIHARFELEKPVFWNPENPYRYRFHITLLQRDSVVDETSFLLGLSKVEIQDNNVLLNSQLLIIRGLEYFEDYPGAGNSVPYDVMEADVLRMKKLGANVVYFKHHPPHPYFVELCNRYGLFILCEAPFPALTEKSFADDRFREDIKTYCRQMVENYRREVSILSWGVANGWDLSGQDGLSFLSELISIVRLADSRPVFCASRFGFLDRIPDEIDIVNLELWNNDFIAANVFATRSMARWPNRVVIATYGAQVYPNNQNGYSDPTSTKFQAKYLVDMFRKLPEWKMAGGIVRSYNDFATSRTYLHGYPTDQTVYTTGLVNVFRKERFAYDFVRAMYTGDKIETIPIGSFENPFPKTFPIVGLLLILAFIVFYRQSPKFSNSVFRSITKILSFFSDVRENRVINLWPALVVGFLGSLVAATTLALIFFELRRNHVFDQIISNIVVIGGIKEWLDHLAWNPELFVFSFTGLIFAGLLVLAGVLRIFAFAFRSGIPFQQTLIAALWSYSHMLLLIPVVIVFQRLIRLDVFMTLLVLIGCWMLVWHLVRIFRISKILFEATWLQVGLIMGGAFLIAALFLGARYSSHHDWFEMMNYVEQIRNSQNYSAQ